jgi:hypothetical protein
MPPAMMLVFPVGVNEPPNVGWALIAREMARQRRITKMVKWSVFMRRLYVWIG